MVATTASKLWLIPLVLSFAAALTFPVGAVGTRLGLWSYKFGFLLIFAGVIVSFGSLLGCLAAMLNVDGWLRPVAIVGAALSLMTVMGSLNSFLTAKSLPSINDITTDMENPPQFKELLKLRQGAETSAEYDKGKTAERQRAGYPMVKPLAFAEPPEALYRRALIRARDLGWHVVGENAEQYTFEAWDRTTWFGFVDDIVVRVTPLPGGARVDIRSHSRVGKSDMGTNARRIMKFSEDF